MYFVFCRFGIGGRGSSNNGGAIGIGRGGEFNSSRIASQLPGSGFDSVSSGLGGLSAPRANTLSCSSLSSKSSEGGFSLGGTGGGFSVLFRFRGGPELNATVTFLGL